jgi:CheY-like chemotaxis protein
VAYDGAPAEGGCDGARHHVFAVNSSVEILAVVGELLEEEGYAVTTSTYGPRVFARIAALRPDAVVLDLAPDENAGWGLLARLRAGEATRGIPVLVVSTDAGLLERAREQEPGVSARRYLAKPMALADVLDAVAELVGRR